MWAKIEFAIKVNVTSHRNMSPKRWARGYHACNLQTLHESYIQTTVNYSLNKKLALASVAALTTRWIYKLTKVYQILIYCLHICLVDHTLKKRVKNQYFLLYKLFFKSVFEAAFDFHDWFERCSNLRADVIIRFSSINNSVINFIKKFC